MGLFDPWSSRTSPVPDSNAVAGPSNWLTSSAGGSDGNVSDEGVEMDVCNLGGEGVILFNLI
jgi:hypothetical protein